MSSAATPDPTPAGIASPPDDRMQPDPSGHLIRHDADTPGMVFLKFAFAGPPIAGAILSALTMAASLWAAATHLQPTILLPGLLAPLLLIPGSYVFGIVPGLVAGTLMSAVLRLTRDRARFAIAAVPACALGGLAGNLIFVGHAEALGSPFLPVLSVVSGLVCSLRVVRLEDSVTMDAPRDARLTAREAVRS